MTCVCQKNILSLQQISITMTEQEIKAKKAASDSAAFQQHFSEDVARYAREWSPYSAANTMPWNSNGLSSVDEAYQNEVVQDERDTLHGYAISLIASFSLSGAKGLDAYNCVSNAYSEYIKKGAPAIDDIDPSSVLSFDEFYARVISKE